MMGVFLQHCASADGGSVGLRGRKAAVSVRRFPPGLSDRPVEYSLTRAGFLRYRFVTSGQRVTAVQFTKVM